MSKLSSPSNDITGHNLTSLVQNKTICPKILHHNDIKNKVIYIPLLKHQSLVKKACVIQGSRECFRCVWKWNGTRGRAEVRANTGDPLHPTNRTFDKKSTQVVDEASAGHRGYNMASVCTHVHVVFCSRVQVARFNCCGSTFKGFALSEILVFVLGWLWLWQWMFCCFQVFNKLICALVTLENHILNFF